jgi:hypothetical protein
MAHPTRLTAALLLILAAGPASADIRLISSDASGVTLRFDLGAWRLQTAPDGVRMLVNAPGLHMMDEPGRPQLPYASALIAVPQGARVTATLTDGGAIESRDSVHVSIGPRNQWRNDPGGLGIYPSIEIVPPSSQGVWPLTDVSVGRPFDLRGQRMVAVEVHPFRYDEAGARLTVHHSMTVRVTFAGSVTPKLGAAGDDRFIEPVLKAALLNYDQGRSMRNARSVPARPAQLAGRAQRRAGKQALAFDEGQTEVRVKLDSTGVWGLDFDDLAANGFPAGVPDSEVSVHRHEFLLDQTPTYATIELPIEVQDWNGNGIFDSGDEIVVYAQDWATRSGASIASRSWGDAEVVYATSLPGRRGLRVGTRDGTPSGTAPVLASYPATRRFEKNFADLYGFPADTLTNLFQWTSNTTYYDRPDTILFETSQLDTTHAVQLSTRMQGRAYQLHVLFASTENKLGQFTSLFDSTSAQWYGEGDFTAVSSLTGSALSEGRTNHFVLWGKNDTSAPSTPNNNSTSVGLDWFDVTYWRRFQNIKGYLDCNNAGATAPYEIDAPAFTDSTFLEAWEVTDPLDPRRITNVGLTKVGANWTLKFEDGAGPAQRSYVVFNTPKFPPADHYTTVTRRGLANHSAADYLLIVPEAFLPAVQPLVDLRMSEGLQVLVAPLESINDEFNGGRHADFAIKRFIRYAYNQWNSRFVTLMGDGAGEDPQNFLGGSNPDWIPAHKVLGPVSIFVGGAELQEIVPSDNWYGWCVNDAGCPDPATQIAVPDLFVGRLPVNSLAEAQRVVHKLVRYETVATTDLWRRRMLLFSDDQFSGENTFGGGATLGYCKRGYEAIFEQLNTVIGSLIPNEAGLRQAEPEVFNMSQYLANEDTTLQSCGYPGCYDVCRTDRAATEQHARANVTPKLFTRLNDGRLWWNYQGHANEELLSHESFYVDNKTTIDDTQNFANDGKPFLFSAFSCHANNFARRWERGDAYQGPLGPGLGGDLVTQGNDQGAIASWASSGYELVPTNPVDHLNVEMARAMFSQPPRDPNLGDRGARVVLGEAIALTLLRWQTSPSSNLGEREVGVTYTLLGDPATRLSIGSPEAFVLANGDTATNDIALHLKTPGDTLRLDADLASNQQITALSLERSIDAAPAVVMPPASYTLTPAFGDTATGGRRYHLLYRASLTPNSYVFTLRTMDREGTPGQFDVLLPFQCVLRAEGVPINDGDPVSPNANLSVLVNSPSPLHPATDITITVNGQAVAFDSLKVAGDPSGRQWVLSWTHGAYPIDNYTVTVTTSGGAMCSHRFKVDVGGGELRIQNALAFPNPFDDDLGTFFSFTLVSGTPSDVLIRVYTLTGQLLYTTTERQLLPGYHQLPWNGRDAEGSTIANGIYIYKIVAHNGSSSASTQGRLVKLRRPKHETVP